MRTQLSVTFVVCAVAAVAQVRAQGADPRLVQEVAAVRAEVARNNDALRSYTWTEHTEVLVKGDVKRSTDMLCAYDRSGELTKTPGTGGVDKAVPSAFSKRPANRKKADIDDYVDRAVSMIQCYVPPKPEQIQYLLDHGLASLEPSEGGKSAIQLKDYYQRGDSMVFVYDPASKRLLRAIVSSTLGSPKDPIRLEAVFETLPNGINHLASTTLEAKARKVQVKTVNMMYQKTTN